MLTVALRRLLHGADLPMPAYATPLSAGVDLFAAVDEPVVLAPLARALVPTGIAIALPANFEAQVRPRSGLAARFGLIQVILINLGAETFTIERGQRIAQLVVAPVTQVAWQETAELADTVRGAGGFGSTGIDGLSGGRSAAKGA